MFDRRIKFIQSVSDALKRYHFSQDVRDFIACQFALESDYGDSELACIHKNFSGMKNPKFRPSTSICAGSDAFLFAEYDSLQSCVDDYVLWVVDRNRRPWHNVLESIDKFAPLLCCYCPEKDYVSKIQRIYSQFKSSFKS